MKGAIFNFIVLQIVVWAFVFKTNDNSTSEVKYASITDTWEVAKIADENFKEIVLHYPSFNQLTLKPNGTYVRLKDDETLESGTWKINEFKSRLTLENNAGAKKYKIIQLPDSETKSFIIQESVEQHNNIASDIKYELTRI